MTGPVPSPALVVEVLDGEAVVWCPQRRRVHRLDRLATDVLSRLDGRGVDDLVEDLVRDYGAPEAVVRADVDRLLDHLVAEGVVTARGPALP